MVLSKCPLCDSPNIYQMEGTVKRNIYGEVIAIPSVTYWVCPDCGEKIFPPESMWTMEDFIKKSRQVATAA